MSRSVNFIGYPRFSKAMLSRLYSVRSGRTRRQSSCWREKHIRGGVQGPGQELSNIMFHEVIGLNDAAPGDEVNVARRHLNVGAVTAGQRGIQLVDPIFGIFGGSDQEDRPCIRALLNDLAHR